MKRVLLVIIGCLLFCTSCDRFIEVDGGFPDKIHIPKEGGELTLTGSMPIISISIYGKDNEKRSRYNKEDGSVEVKNHWLIARAETRGSKTFSLTAEPNTSNKSRKFDIYINYTSGLEYACFTVKQD
ncbi:MAG: BACON domain-containing protein [Tidjanibacter sp.]|nr:BACON domain-containing protein [Tidjanibacter sp.]MBR4063701.1 BACON domain-containing protein [Tidjanibacter sp.]